MAKIVSFGKSPIMPSIKLLPSDIPLLMHCLNVDYYFCIDLMGIDEKDIDRTRDKLISPLDNDTPDVLAMEPPIPGDDLDGNDFMQMEGDSLICNILMLRSLKQRLAILSLSTPDKKGNFELSYNALESGILISAVEMQVEELETEIEENKDILTHAQVEKQYLDESLNSLNGLYDALNSISKSNDDRTATFMKLPVGQQLAVLEQFLPPLKNPGDILAGSSQKKDIDLLGVIPQSTLFAEYLGYNEPDCILQDYELTADYADYVEEDEDGNSTKVSSIIRASITRIPKGGFHELLKLATAVQAT